MNEIVRVVATAGVLGVQLVLPLAIGAYEIFGTTPVPTTPARSQKLADRLKRKRAAAEVKAPALEPLRCPKCTAPVPLLARSFACPHCSAPIEPPADYVKALDLRVARDAMLGRAERVWRRSRFTSARPTTALMRVAVLAWAAAVIAACVSAIQLEWTGAGFFVFLAVLLTFVQVLVFFALVSVFADGRTELPPVPRGEELRCDAAEGVCAGCAGPFMFAKDRFGATCAYCGAENFRAALAQQTKSIVERGEDAARGSLMEQIRAWDMRRTETLGVFGILAIAEVFYAVVVGITLVGIFVSDVIGL